MSKVRIIDMDAENIFEYGFCGTRNIKHEGCRRKAEWFKKRQTEGMRYKVLYSEEKGTVGLIEYIPGEYAWRAIDADGYMVIHCLCIFYKPYREKGVATKMIDECIEDAKKEKKHGVAVVTRRGAWMVGLTILWSDQCPYIAKSINEIRETIKERYGINANIVKIKDHKQAQEAPSPYAIFSLIYDGELLAFHPISNKRFMNIMDKVLKLAKRRGDE